MAAASAGKWDGLDVRTFYLRLFRIFKRFDTNNAMFAELTNWQASKVGEVVEWGESADEPQGTPRPELPETRTVLGIAAGTDTSLDELLAGVWPPYDARVVARYHASSGQKSSGQSTVKLLTSASHKEVDEAAGAASRTDETHPHDEGHHGAMTPKDELLSLARMIREEDAEDAIGVLGEIYFRRYRRGLHSGGTNEGTG